MSWIVENWYIIFSMAILIFVTGMIIGNFCGLPTSEKEKNIKEWLKWAVVEAEKELGAKTGQLKLRKVYELAVEKFPWIINVISFDTFSKWVDEALNWMNNQLESNVILQLYVKGE